ncbi:hypothetical protein JYU34_007227 [Plutella xylostella]|uniref:FAD-binding FR-type domain-containing protein n=1 Tax=Plutella xylostella TaxID=51655 RepID=A0ABQ7QPX3_PLUXY|nr:hypothetical protein JYU34_007227 [Plutella xylostella]
MAGRTIGLHLSCPSREFKCRIGQYVLLQCLDISLIEWHPFTVVKLPTSSQRNFTLWIRVTGDWTEGLERLLLERGPKNLTMLVDGPYTSAMQGVSRSGVSVCVAAGVGVTPFVAVLQDLLLYPRNRLPGRVHLIWIVRYEQEISWLADLATRTIQELRNSNRPDRLQIELYVTNSKKPASCKNGPLSDIISHVVAINENGYLTHSIIRNDKNSLSADEKMLLLTPHLKRSASHKNKEESITRVNDCMDDSFKVADKFPLLGCRVKKGRPQWNRLFSYWAHLYPGEHLSLYCCGPKKLVKELRNKSNYITQTTSTSITFVSEGFS